MYTGRILSTGMNCEGKPFVGHPYNITEKDLPDLMKTECGDPRMKVSDSGMCVIS